ncbi:unnamed protein product [Hydatigera taeniaeformis]|uniref:RRM domain-containing protein n=1 Tax=Hydatigena taeniaeformis TaxID=6205 RepID=A0A0R3WIJ7_HYDTA|nr:unnamed protein product [Hydatigera taeniaeformis]
MRRLVYAIPGSNASFLFLFSTTWKPSKPPESNPKKKMIREAKSALKNLCPTSVAVRIPSGRNRRYAFIEFKTPAEAETAAKEVTGRVMNGKSIRAIVCSQKPTRTEADWQSPMERGLDAFDLTTLYVSCLPRSTERTILAQIFRTAHKIKYETLPDGTSKGFCVLKYQTRELAQKAFMERHDTLLKGTPIYVNFLIKSKAKLDGDEVMKREGVLHRELKRKAPEEDEVVVMPAKKRCCGNMDPEQVGVVDDSTVQARKIATKNKAEKGVHVTLPSKLNNRDPSFSIKYSMGPKSKKPKLQPYQLSKKSDNRIKKLRRPK